MVDSFFDFIPACGGLDFTQRLLAGLVTALNSFVGAQECTSAQQSWLYSPANRVLVLSSPADNKVHIYQIPFHVYQPLALPL